MFCKQSYQKDYQHKLNYLLTILILVNPETWSPFKLSQDSTVTAKIYDVTGKQIRMIELGHIPAGNYVESNRAIYWDGRTEDGEQVSSGTYFYQIEAGDYTETRKMVILK